MDVTFGQNIAAMFLFKGYNTETREWFQKEFEDEYDAISYGPDNAFDHPKYQVIDLDTDEVIHTNADDEDAEETAMDNMFPDEESKEGFDWTRGE